MIVSLYKLFNDTAFNITENSYKNTKSIKKSKCTPQCGFASRG